MTDYAAVAQVLGLKARHPASPLQLNAFVGGGLSVTVLEQLSKTVSPSDAGFKYRIVPKASLLRRTSQLSGAESQRVARLAKVWTLALEVWGGDAEARDFLFRSHPMLEDARPIDLVLDGELGASVVEDVLGGLQHGTAA